MSIVTDFDYSGIVPKKDRKKIQDDASKLAFGKAFTDHMFCMKYEGGEWKKGEFVKYDSFSLHPAALVLHYGQECFEGLKAFRNKKGEISLFRPDMNAKRLNRSCKRLAIPELPEQAVLDALRRFCQIEKDWIPQEIGTSLYLRPTVIATQSALGLRCSDSYTFFIIGSPVGSYFAAGFKPVKIWIERNLTRAFKGGVGDVKAGANYAASLLACEIAKSHGCAQTLWTDAQEHKYIEEVGAMNVFAVIDGVVTTAPLGGTILPGVTRCCVLDLCSKLFGLKTEERLVSVDELVGGIKSGKVTEVFGSGTAASIAPVGQLMLDSEVYVINNNEVGPLAKRLYDTIQGIQFRLIEDTFKWNVFVDGQWEPCEDKTERPAGPPENAAAVVPFVVPLENAHIMDEETFTEMSTLKYVEPNRDSFDVYLKPESERLQKRVDMTGRTFGSSFTDHMVVWRFKDGKWGKPAITEVKDFELKPASIVFHYCQEFFEGLKAFLGPDGKPRIFRPDRNIERFNRSARRLCMPTVDSKMFMDVLCELISIERLWIPEGDTSALYIRPWMFGTEEVLGVRPSAEYIFCILLSPVGPYFGPVVKPTKLCVPDFYTRAVKGGVGNVKAGGNYVTSLLATVEAKSKGCDQVLWLDGHDRKYVEEVGAMNIMFVAGDVVYTAPLRGTILPGITRESVIHLLRKEGKDVKEVGLDIQDLCDWIESGKITEVFGCGTAATIVPVGSVLFKDKDYIIKNGKGVVGKLLTERLIGVQHGVREDFFGWNMVIP